MSAVPASGDKRDAQIRMYYKFGMSVWRLSKGTGLSETHIKRIINNDR